jgi:hypothetical protein
MSQQYQANDCTLNPPLVRCGLYFHCYSVISYTTVAGPFQPGFGWGGHFDFHRPVKLSWGEFVQVGETPHTFATLECVDRRLHPTQCPSVNTKSLPLVSKSKDEWETR